MAARLISLFFIILIIASIIYPQGRVSGWDAEALENVDNTINMLLEKDPGLQTFFYEAYGYAVFPIVGKGAIGIGGAHGNGIVFEKGVPVGKTTLTQITIGFQFGGKAYSEINFFENKEVMDLFKTSRFELAAQASAVAVTLGASADLAYSNGVAIITIDKGGLMYEASVGGQKFSYEPVEEKEETPDTLKTSEKKE